MPPLVVPVGQRTWLGVAKETTFGIFVNPTIFHGCESNSPVDKHTVSERPGPRGFAGRTPAAPGKLETSLSVKLEPDPDTVFQLIAYAMGNQSAPALHSPSTLAYDENMSFGTLGYLPSFSCQYFRDNATEGAVDMPGCCVDTLKLSLQPGSKLGVDLGIVAQLSVPDGSPATPTFSKLYPLTAEGQLQNSVNSTIYNGTAIGIVGQAMVRGWDITLNNNLDKSFRTIGNPYVQGFPLGTRKVSGSFKADFASEQQYLDFLAQGIISLAFNVASSSVADPVGATGAVALYYNTKISMKSCRIVQHTVPQKTSGSLEQTISFEAYRTQGSSAQDDLFITTTTLASAIY
jgi:hypothetical protein